MHFVEASAYLRTVLYRLRAVGVRHLIYASPGATRKIEQFGTLGLQQRLENAGLSYLSRLCWDRFVGAQGSAIF
jgi:hypothetical protein